MQHTESMEWMQCEYRRMTGCAMKIEFSVERGKWLECISELNLFFYGKFIFIFRPIGFLLNQFNNLHFHFLIYMWHIIFALTSSLPFSSTFDICCLICFFVRLNESCSIQFNGMSD